MKKEYGIYIPAPTCRDRRLSTATRIAYGQIVQLAKKNGFCHASNSFLATQCGLNRDTVSASVGTLLRHGLVTVEDDGSVRRITPTRAAAGPAAAEVAGGRATAPREGAAEFSADAAESSVSPAENDRGHLKDAGSVNEGNEEESSSSLSFSAEDAQKRTVSAGTAIRQAKPTYDLQRAKALVAEWGQQVRLRLSPRMWDRRTSGGSVQRVKLDVPSVGIPSARNIEALVVLALDIWPGSDPLMAFRQLLRASAWTSNNRDALQQYAYVAASGALAVRALLRLGGPGDRLSFVRDAAGAVPAPPPPAPTGNTADAPQLLKLGYDSYGCWTYDAWQPCWTEAAGRLGTLPGVPHQCFMAAVFDLYECAGRTAPLPWFADGITREVLAQFADKYGDDRLNAWSGGPCRTPTDPRRGRGEYDYRCVGWEFANAVAAGRTTFRSKSCLLCAAAELRIMPVLVKTVPWPGTADELAARLEQLATTTTTDDPPQRGVGCGQIGTRMPSLIRCHHGLKDGTWYAYELAGGTIVTRSV